LSPAIGFRVKSGWAATALLDGPRGDPRLIDVRRLELADPRTPGSYQPYHASTGTAQTNRAIIQRLVDLVLSTTLRALRGLLEEYRASGAAPQRIALVVGSTTDPASISHPHMRAHASEGQLFRHALAEAARACDLAVTTTRERDLLDAASAALGIPAVALREQVTALGRGSSFPWRAEHKQAALAAWLLL